MPTYAGGHMAFGWGSDLTDLSSLSVHEVQARLDAQPFNTRYYNAEVHAAAFALPACTRALMC